MIDGRGLMNIMLRSIRIGSVSDAPRGTYHRLQHVQDPLEGVFDGDKSLLHLGSTPRVDSESASPSRRL
jgi:hypothetical protein